MKQRKCSGLMFGGGCQAALDLTNNICSGTGNSQLMGTNFLADFRGHNKPEWFPSHPQPLLAPGLMAFVLPQLHLPTAAPWRC